MNTRITELLGIEAPIIQGAMARIADASLAGAVSAAGGLGIIACGGAPLEWVEQQVAAARKITDNPIGANVMLMDPNAAELARLLVDLKIDVITTGAGSPANYIDMWKEAGIKVIPVVATTALAKRMERLGADAVVAEGTESGGHVGELTTMALVPAVCDTVSIPVIAAGGIADGRGVAAVFALGAEGVQMGTRFLTVEECTVSDAYKERVLAAKDSDTIVTGRGSGHPVRCLKNKFSRNVRKLEADLTKNGDELEAMYVGSLRRAVEGDVDNGSMMAGQVAALVHERKTAQEVIGELMAQAQAVGARYAQPATCALSVGIASALQARGAQPQAVLGFSLGQVSALAVSGMLTYEETFSFVAERARLMAQAAAERPGVMSALLKAEEESVAQLCEGCAQGQVLVPANFNCPGQIVISGELAAVERAEAAWEAAGKRYARLATSGAFHSPLMQPAADELDVYLAKVDFKQPSIPLICNTDAQPLSAEVARRHLVDHLTHPVRFEQSVQALADQGADVFAEVGFGGVLSNLVKRIDRKAARPCIQDAASFDAFVSEYAEDKE